jgi:hypothetical protein
MLQKCGDYWKKRLEAVMAGKNLVRLKELQVQSNRT